MKKPNDNIESLNSDFIIDNDTKHIKLNKNTSKKGVSFFELYKFLKDKWQKDDLIS